MERQQAINIIQDTLQNSFNEQSFHALVKHLLKHIEYTPQTVYRGNIIPDAFNRYIRTATLAIQRKKPDFIKSVLWDNSGVVDLDPGAARGG